MKTIEEILGDDLTDSIKAKLKGRTIVVTDSVPAAEQLESAQKAHEKMVEMWGEGSPSAIKTREHLDEVVRKTGLQPAAHERPKDEDDIELERLQNMYEESCKNIAGYGGPASAQAIAAKNALFAKQKEVAKKRYGDKRITVEAIENQYKRACDAWGTGSIEAIRLKNQIYEMKRDILGSGSSQELNW